MSKGYLEASSSNVFTLNIEDNIEYFKLSINNTNTKTISISNSNYIESEITIKIVYNASATITFPSSITWKDGVTPSFTAGKTYFIYLITENTGTSYQGVWTGGW